MANDLILTFIATKNKNRISLSQRDTKRIMTEFMGPRPGEDLSVLGELDFVNAEMPAQQGIALVMWDSYKLLEP